jgi:hypothetical protein
MMVWLGSLLPNTHLLRQVVYLSQQVQWAGRDGEALGPAGCLVPAANLVIEPAHHFAISTLVCRAIE